MNKFWSTLLAGAAGGLVTFGAMHWTQRDTQSKGVEQEPKVISRPVRFEEGSGGMAFDFTRAAERSMPAVVHIKASESQQTAIERYKRTNPFHFFFGDSFFFEDEIRPRSGTGSGVIYTSDGYILTNNHVIEFADEYTVTLHDGREFKARLVGADASTDMAVLKIDATNLPAIEIGNSDAVRVGEWVLAVGNPFDLTSTVTAGIVSAKSRDINIIRRGAPIESFIQTDAAVNPGNSGGALVDVQGRLVGINTAIASPTGTFAGYSFAIPVNLARRIADDLIKYGKYRRPYLGVDIAPMDNQIANYLGIPFVQGVWVRNLDPKGSAARSGVRPNDVITKVNNRPISSVPELQEIIARSKAGETITLTIVREGREKTLNVQLLSRGD
ncbi:MAG: trypsin-like peptidase domain-containing protein [Saprospiraceae bacterium]|nr:trypsin-like peptidase domain-containing protein [Saprospiraceae bacterium]MDW8483606.1 trypsin-like peptidase domain-containing protein [Saprospiraceae bacterium]